MKTIATRPGSSGVTAQLRERLAAFRTAHPRERVTFAGTVWSYLSGGEDSANGPAFVILPGGERIGDLAFPLMQAFKSEYRCLYPAYPPVPTMAALVEGLAALLDTLAIDSVILFGASFGGDLAQCFVRAHADRVRRLILLNTGIPDEQLGRATQRGRRLVQVLPLGILRALTSGVLSKVLSTRPEERMFWLGMLRQPVQEVARADMLASFDDTIDYRLHYHFEPTDLATWRGSVLILQSDDDPATTPTRRQALRALYPQAQVRAFHNAGHTPFLSQPDAFYARVRAFLHETDPL